MVNVVGGSMVKSAYSLHENAPKTLVGMIYAGVKLNGMGWVLLNLSDEPNSVKLTTTDHNTIEISIFFEFAITLASRLLCVVNQNRAIRAQNHFAQPVSQAYQGYGIKYENELFQLSLPIDNINLEATYDEDIVQLCIEENLTEQISMSLFKEIGIKMANGARLVPDTDPDFVLY